MLERSPLRLVAACVVGAVLAGCTGRGAEPVRAASPTAPPFTGAFTDLTDAVGLRALDVGGHADFTANAPMLETAGIFADLDGDGFPEVIVYSTPCGARSRPVVYRYDRAARGLVATDLALPVAAPLAAVDLDGDGHLDLLSAHSAEGVAWGRADGTFEAPAPLGAYAVGEGCGTPFRAVYYADVDEDGLLDVLYGVSGCLTDFAAGPGVRVFLNNGTRRFDERTDLVVAAIESGSSAVMLTSIGERSRVLLTTAGADCRTGVWGKGAYVDAGRGEDGYPRFREFDVVPPATGFRASFPPGQRSASIMYYGAMGFASGDLDGDGLLDLSITLNPWHGFFQAAPGALTMLDRTQDTGLMLIPALASERPQLPWGVAFVDLDLDGRLDVVVTHGDDFIPDPVRYIGPQSVTAHRNVGGFVFEDVTAVTGLGRLGQFVSLAVGDLDRDGKPDLIVGGQDLPPRVFRNDLVTPNHALAIALRGTTSNALGIGAHVYVLPVDGAPEQHHMMAPPGSPLATSEPLVFAGLGAATSARRVRVVWPSGLSQEVFDVPSGTVTRIEEAPTLALEPARRRFPADGATVVRVRVLPRAADGSLRAAQVSLRILSGGGVLTGPIVGGGDGALFELRAPSASGSTVLEASIDGAPVGIRPRLWWEPT